MKPILKYFPYPKTAANLLPSGREQAQAKFKAGLALHNQGQLARAKAIYFEVIGLQPDNFDALHMLGVLAAETDKPAQALEWIGKAIEVNPNVASAYSNLGNALSAMKQYQAAIDSYDKAIAINPAHANAHHNRGLALHTLKQHQAAVESYDKAIGIKPNHADAYCNLGLALHELKQHRSAIQNFDKALAIDPNHALAHCNRGLTLHDLNEHQAAVDSYDEAIAINPAYADAYSNRGNALHKLGQHQAAVHSFDKAICINPEHAEAHHNRGISLNELRRREAAIESYDKAIAIKPDFAEAYAYRGKALEELNQHGAAVDSYTKAISIKPDFAEAHFDRGVALIKLKQHQAALESFDKAIAILPGFAMSHANRGQVLMELKQFEAAIDSFDKALSISSDLPFIYGTRLHTKMRICDWHAVGNQIIELCQKIQNGTCATPPFAFLALSDSLALQRKAAEIWVSENEKKSSSLEVGVMPKRVRQEKIRIAYFSADYHNHATAYLMAGLFEQHDKSRFELIAFSFGPDLKDEMRQRVRAAFDKFIDVRDKSDKEVALLCRSLNIDIAIDLKGFTQDQRAGIFSHRAAPLQVSYLGYPGTMGAGYIDYLIADKTLIPEPSQQYYAEKIAYLPNSYQVNDSTRKINDKVFTREELGLPVSGFVFCCFNNNYKITPGTFDGWIRILQRVEGSVLWLFEDSPGAADNLRQEAQRRGLNPRRLVFARLMPQADHLARLRAADLLIDTFPYNAHTTASDALWVSLPVLTRPGEAFASRVAASLLTAIDMPELIASTPEEYETMAVELATDHVRFKAIKEKLERNRLSTSLFDTKLFSRNIENAYTQMYERYHAGLAPDHIWV